MKRKNILLILMLAIGLPWTTAWADSFTIPGTATTGSFPIYSLYADYGQKSEFIIPASLLTDLPNGAVITSMQLPTTTTGSWSSSNFVVKMANTTTNSHSGYTNASFIANSGTEVYGGTIASASTVTINFTTNFMYTGNNIVVQIANTSGTYSSSSTWSSVQVSNSSGYLGIHRYNSSGDTGTSNYNNNGSGWNYVPKLTFTYTTPPSNSTCATATTLSCGSTLNGTTVGTPGTAHGISGASISNYGVWYTFMGDGGETTVSSSTGGEFDHGMAIASGSCNNLTLLDVVDGHYASGTESYNFTTVSGETYYIYVAHYDSNSSTTGTFTISRTCSYTVSYNANGGTGTMTDSNSPYVSGSTVTVMSNAFTAPSGMTFSGWNTASDGSGTSYDPNDTFTISANTTLYAQWASACNYSEDFEGVTGTSGYSTAGSLPTGWNYIWNGSNTAYAPHVYLPSQTDTPGLPSTGNYLGFFASGSTSEYSYAIMPAFASGEAANHISFKYKFESASNGTLTYGVIDGTDASTYTILGTISNPSNNPGTVDVDLNVSQTKGKRIAFRWYKTSTWYTCGIDDICVMTSIPTHTITATADPTTGGTVSFMTGPANSTTARTHLPLDSYRNYSFSQQIYTPDEVGGGTISSISLYSVDGNLNDGVDFTRTLAVYMAHTDKTEFSSTSDWISNSDSPDMALVYSGNVTFDCGEWNTINFTNSFTYDGTRNLVLIIADNTGTSAPAGNYLECKTFTPSSGGYCSLNHDTQFNPSSPSGNGERLTEKNQILINPGSSDSRDFPEGASCTLVATPNDGYRFVDWTENNSTVGNSTTYTISNIQADHDLVAHFERDSYTLTTSANPSAGGTVSPSGNNTYTPGTSVQLSATANTGYSFTNWTENGSVLSSNANYTITMNADHTVVANFTQNNYTISYSPTSSNPSNGCYISGNTSAHYGDNITVTLHVATGYELRSITAIDGNNNTVTLTGSGITDGSTYTFSMPASNVTVTAEFKRACMVPTNLAESTTINSATITWDDSYGSEWQVAHATSSSANPDNNIISPNVTEQTYTMGNLTLGSTHYFWVRSYCSVSEQSAWVGPVEVVIECTAPGNTLSATATSTGAVLTWDGGTGEEYIVELGTVTTTTGTIEIMNEGFEEGITGWTSSNSSVSWTRGTKGYYTSRISSAYEGDYLAYPNVGSSGNSSNTGYFISPVMDLSGYTNVKLTCWYINPAYNNSYSDTFGIYYRTSSSGSWTSLFSTSAGHASWTQTSQLTLPSQSYVQLGFYFADGNGYGVAIDDILIEGTGTISTTSWSSIATDATSPYTITGCNIGTTYKARVKDQCDNVSNEVDFTPDCTAPTNLVAHPSSSGAVLTWDGGTDEEYTVQYRTYVPAYSTLLSEDFESMSLSTSYSSSGWYAYNAGSGNNWSLDDDSDYSYSGTHYILYLYNSSYAANCYLVSPPFAVSSNMTNLTVSLYERVDSSYPEQFEVFFVKASDVTTLSGVASVTHYSAIASTTYTNNSYTQITGSNSAAALAGTDVRLVVHCTSAANMDFVAIDDVEVTSQNSGTSGSWTIIPGTHEPPYNLTGLTTGTTYQAQVIDQCGNESNIVTFTPACGAPLNVAADPSNRSAEVTWLGGESSYDVRYKKGFSYDFESAEPWTYTDFSPCTTYDGDGTQSGYFTNWSFTNQGYTGSYIAFQNGILGDLVAHNGQAFGACFYTTQNNDFFILPEITINTGDVFSFWARSWSEGNLESFKVGIYDSNGSFSSYLAGSASTSVTAPYAWTEFSYNLNSYAGQTIRLAINCVSADMYIFLIDDIFVGNPNDSWTTVNNVTSPDTITGLTANTNYVVQVQSTSCGDWVGTNFTTLNEFNVTANVNPANSGTVTGAGTYAEGSNVTLTATPATGYGFQNWTIGGSVVGTTPSYTINNLQADVTIQVNFLFVGYTITAVADPAGSGTFAFTGEDVISSTATTAQVSPDGNVTVTATATAGYTFMNWTEGGSVVSTTNAYALTGVNASHNLTAHFVDMTASNTWPAAVTTLVAATPGYSVDGSTITISNANGLAWLISTVNGLNSQSGNDITSSTVINLTADVDMSAHIWVPIGTTEHPFVGTFNGNGHTISGVNRALEFPNQGVFGYVSGGTIHDVVVNTNITGDCNYMGSVAGTLASGTVYNTGSTGTVTANANTIAVGGTVGYNGGLVHSSFATGIFTGLTGDYVGGLVGENAAAGRLYNSYSNATLTGGERGGLVGYNKGTAANCYNVNNSGTYAYANINAGTIEYVYSDNTNNSYYRTVEGSATLQHHGSSFSAVQSDIKHLDYMYRDNAITLDGGQTNSYVPSSVSYDNNHTVKWNGLVSALNQWVEANKTSGANISDLSSWYRPLTTNINGDLPVLGFNGETTLGAANGSPKALKYGTMDYMLTTYNNSTASIFHYGKATGVTHVPTANVNVYIDEDAVLLQATNPDPGPFINTTVGVTFDNSDHGTHAYDYWGNKLNYDWHFMSTPLSDAKIGATYDDYEAHGFGSDIDIKTLVNSYFPNNLPMALHDANWRWDFYTYYEPEYHWINLKRNKNNHYHVDGGWSISYTYNADDQAVGDEASLACVFTPGKGYMMAISKDVFMNSTGTLNRGNVPIRLTLKEPGDINYASGWNLVGNPYQAYLNINSLNRNLYIYDADQGVYAPYAPAASGNPATPSQYIHPHQAFFVHAASDGEELTFTQAMASTETTPYSYYRDDRIDYPLVNLYAENNAGQRDLTVVEFHRPELGGTRKLETMRNAPFTIAAHYAGMSYGILFATDDIERIPVRFKTDESGWVTLTWSTHNGVFSKLLLIDNKLGVEHNMLADNSYTFEASPDDYSSRFYIVYDCSGMGIEENEDDGGASTGSATFAYINNGNIVIDVDTGHGASIQVIDVLGRVLYSKTIAGTEGTSCTVSTKGLAKGIYLIRLADGHNVKTQKLVVQ